MLGKVKLKWVCCVKCDQTNMFLFPCSSDTFLVPCPFVYRYLFFLLLGCVLILLKVSETKSKSTKGVWCFLHCYPLMSPLIPPRPPCRWASWADWARRTPTSSTSSARTSVSSTRTTRALCSRCWSRTFTTSWSTASSALCCSSASGPSCSRSPRLWWSWRAWGWSTPTWSPRTSC